MPDWWEQLNFGNPTNKLSGEDEDVDTVSNLDEYVADTNPNDSNSFLRITSISSAGTNKTVSFPSSSNRIYNVHFLGNLETGAWSNLLSNVPGNGSTNDVPTANTEFLLNYRIEVLFP